MVVGASGGTKITTAVALVMLRHLWFGQTIKQAVDAPRFHHQLYPMLISYEYGILDQLIKGLQAKGHRTMRYRNRGSIICAMSVNSTGIYANADYRKGGDVYGL
uniref:Putative secreted protein n=1 Tax=Xenopsylla cheopis TaxID=163159 RepID=A0A6M2DXF2_XENCH